ncbi:MAG: flagellar FliJ family protein [bacterium]|nr:flagellar FliJ family protein [bacterium]
MKKYKFSLARVLRVRKIQETLRLVEQNRAERALKAQQQKLEMFTTERDIQCQAMEVAMLQEFRIADKQTDWKYLQRIDLMVGYQRSVVTEYTKHESEARQRFMIARQRSLSLEKLGEKHRETWSKELIEFEQKLADDRPRKTGRDKQ